MGHRGQLLPICLKDIVGIRVMAPADFNYWKGIFRKQIGPNPKALLVYLYWCIHSNV